MEAFVTNLVQEGLLPDDVDASHRHSQCREDIGMLMYYHGVTESQIARAIAAAHDCDYVPNIALHRAAGPNSLHIQDHTAREQLVCPLNIDNDTLVAVTPFPSQDLVSALEFVTCKSVKLVVAELSAVDALILATYGPVDLGSNAPLTGENDTST